MAEESIHLKVVTPERTVLDTFTSSIIAPAATGYLGILKNHAPLLTSLTPGVLSYTVGGQKKKMAVSGGFLEVADNNVTVLADTAETEEEINIERAKRAKERAEERLRKRTPDIDVARAEAALRRALARLKAAGVE